MNTVTATCYRHPDRETAVACSSCARPICPDCMISTPVGMRCPECSRERTKVVSAPAAVAATPYATYGLIAVNVVVFIASLGAGSEAALEGGGSMIRNGGLFGPAVDGGEWYRILTSGFLHAGAIHLMLNMIVLWILGGMLEPAIGPVRLLGIYFVSLLAGAFGALLLAPEALTVGASGAVFGLMGAALVIARSRQLEGLAGQIGILIAINLVITFSIPDISIGGHLGGLAGGALSALILSAGQARPSQRIPIEVSGLAVLAVASVLGALAVAA